MIVKVFIKYGKYDEVKVIVRELQNNQDMVFSSFIINVEVVLVECDVVGVEVVIEEVFSEQLNVVFGQVLKM